MENLLSKAKPSDVITDPFPHVVLRNVLGPETSERLRRHYPPLDVVAKGEDLGSNLRFNYYSFESLEDPRVPEIWKELVRAHTSQNFLDDVIRVFGPHIEAEHPAVMERYGSLDGLKAGLRLRDTFDEADVLLGAPIAMNTPVTEEPDSVRGPHVDAPNKLLTGLYYLRHPDDRSEGGTLELYRYRKDGVPLHSGQHVDSRHIERVKQVPYQNDTFVFFLNSLKALHGVTVRSRTPYPRLFLNLIGEVDCDQYDRLGLQEGRISRWLRKIGLREKRTSEYHE